MRLSDRVAHLIVHRPGRLWLLLAALLLVAGGLIAFRAKLNSDVLDMLPGHFESVQIYKVADREFSSARELLFGLLADSDDVDVDGFTEHFATMLRGEPWIVRVMEQSPLDAPGGLEELRAVALPLMLNQPDDEFAGTIAALQPDAITARLGKLRAKVEAGVGVSQAELEYDPLGIVFPALKSLRMRKGKSGDDPKFRVVFAHCDQPDLNEPACNETMAKVEDFKRRALSTWDGPSPQVLCTGRTAYVSEMAGKLKADISATMASSMLLVALTFYAGFRRWKPLRAIVDALLLCCVLAVACGAAFFGSLNMITIGLCSILVGLGVDFAMVLYALYAAELQRGLSHEAAVATALRTHAGGVWLGAVTTAASFLCLLGSGSLGYMQLGVLIACGILLAAAAMMTFFWLFLGITLPHWLYKLVLAGLAVGAAVGIYFIVTTFRTWSSNTWQNIGIGSVLAVVTMAAAHWFCRWITRLPAYAMDRSWRLACPAAIVLAALCTYAASPVGKIEFDLDPKSLEPRNSNAGHALRTIMKRLNSDGVDSVMAVIEAKDAEAFSANWAAADKAWHKLTAEGGATEPLLQSVVTPAGLATSPARMTANAAKLATLDLTNSKAAFDAALAANDFPAGQFAGARGLLDALADASAGKLNVVEWRRNLPETSAWWFLIDSFISRERLLGIARLKPPADIEDADAAAKLRAALALPGIEVGLSGWGYTLSELGGWSKDKMWQLTALMICLNVTLLSILLRAWKPVLVLMLGLALSVGALFATLKGANALVPLLNERFPGLELGGFSLNLFNILAFPLVLGVGVDYGIYIAIALRSPDARHELASLIKPVLLSGMTTVVGFGSLAWAQNPALRGLGLLCGIGVAWCLLVMFVFVLPACALVTRRKQ
jgi:uncharacterized protein